MDQIKYAIVDLETTGTDISGKNRIIQIGCTFVQNNKIIDEFSYDVNPEMDIPMVITRLTGIDNERVKNAPKMVDIAQTVYQRLAGTVFVAHNVNFDYPFLNTELERCGYPSLEISAIDTVSLSQVLIPEAPGYRLRDLTGYLQIEHNNPHSANSDSRATANLLIELMKRANCLPMTTLESLIKLGQYLPANTNELLKQTLTLQKKHPAKLATDLIIVGGIAIKEPTPIVTPEQHPINQQYPKSKKAKQLLYADTYEWRKSQASLMNYIYQQFETDDNINLVVEAPTGMGKTFGYLLPLSYMARAKNRQVVISVPTKILQTQLFEAANRMNHVIFQDELIFAIIKSSGNYISLDQFKEQITGAHLSKESRILAMKILVWLLKTTTGDLDEFNSNVGFSNFIDTIRHRGEMDFNSKSDFYDYDFYNRVLLQKQYANFLITNHNYTIQHADELADQKNAYLVIDEAQHFVETMRSANITEFDFRQFNQLIQQLSFKFSAEFSDFAQTDALVNFHVGRLIDHLTELTTKLEDLTNILFKTFIRGRLTAHQDDQPFEVVIERNKLNQKLLINVLENATRILSEWDSVRRRLKRVEIAKTGLNVWNQIMSYQPQFSAMVENLQDLADNLLQMKVEDVYWLQVGMNHDPNHLKLAREIVNPGNFYRNNIESYFNKILLIGGTLFAGSNRHFFLDNFSFAEKPIVRSFTSTQDLSGQLQVDILDNGYTLGNDDNQFSFEDYLADSIYEIAKTVNRQTLVLFNSLDTIERVYSLLHQTDLAQQRPILAQGVHGSNAKIIREFNDQDNAILLGAASFWEGVDFPGDRLDLLIITRLPFKSPNHRQTQFANEKYGNSFMQFLLPDALLIFRQGLGRLIRNSKDRGAVVILDNRILHRKYGNQFLKQIPSGVNPVIGKLKQVKKQLINFFD